MTNFYFQGLNRSHAAHTMSRFPSHRTNFFTPRAAHTAPLPTMQHPASTNLSHQPHVYASPEPTHRPSHQQTRSRILVRFKYIVRRATDSTETPKRFLPEGHIQAKFLLLPRPPIQIQVIVRRRQAIQVGTAP
ncbi:hypothetical protein M3J07_004248 [Ascochyta lentis]